MSGNENAVTLRVGDQVEVLRAEYLLDGEVKQHDGLAAPKVGDLVEVISVVTHAEREAFGNLVVKGHWYLDPAAVRPVTAEADQVNHPSHYTWGPVEVIEITERLGFCLGNVIKYVLRADHKGKPLEDLEKAQWYLTREIARRKAEQ